MITTTTLISPPPSSNAPPLLPHARPQGPNSKVNSPTLSFLSTSPSLSRCSIKCLSRKPWYKRAMEAVNLWRPTKRSTPIITSSNKHNLNKCSSLRIASSFTHVFLCAPIASYNKVFLGDAAPRRSYSYPRSKTFATAGPVERAVVPRASLEGRRVIFRGKSLTDDLLMRRFVVEEETMMQVRRRNEMEVIRRRVAARRRRIGPSRLSRMSMAGECHEV